MWHYLFEGNGEFWGIYADGAIEFAGGIGSKAWDGIKAAGNAVWNGAKYVGRKIADGAKYVAGGARALGKKVGEAYNEAKKGLAEGFGKWDDISEGDLNSKGKSNGNNNNRNNGLNDYNSKRQTPNQKALRNLAKESEKSAKRGNPISEEEAKILDDWADEYNVPQHHKAYPGSGTHFKGGNNSDHTHIYNIHVPYK